MDARIAAGQAREETPAELYARLERALLDVEPPFACVDLDAFDANGRDMLRRAGGKPIRVASKSIRCRALLERALKLDAGFRGVLAFTLPEALWLADQGFDDLLVAYPTTDRVALRALVSRMAQRPGLRLTVMVDSPEHLDFIDAAVGRERSVPIRVCLDVDAGYRLLRGKVRIGARRSPLHEPAQVVALARAVLARPGFALVGLMAYEAQIAGVGDLPAGRPLFGMAVRAMQRLSATELAGRRARVVEAVRAVAPLELVDGGGTGSLERTGHEPALTELAAGSGFFAPALFDTYRAFRLRPAAFFAAPVVRRPAPGVVTVLGAGYPASGAAGADRLPTPFLPPGLSLVKDEGAGEVQTPLEGAAAEGLAVGARVYFRHAKAGELCERFDRLHLVQGDRVVDVVPTYRGEGRCFL